jgi:hypothetical protein
MRNALEDPMIVVLVYLFMDYLIKLLVMYEIISLWEFRFTQW